MTAATTAETVAKLLRKTKKPEVIGVYAFEELQLTVWGWKEGKVGTENKHELPPPIDEVLLFGDAVVSSADADGTPQDLTVEEWETFHEETFKGFEETASAEESGDEEEPAEEADAAVEEEGVDEESEDEVAEEEEDDEDVEDEVEEEEDADEDCYDDGDDAGGGGKRRAPRRRAIAAPEYRRMEMGLRSRVKLPAPLGKRAPRWQTASELTEEAYTL